MTDAGLLAVKPDEALGGMAARLIDIAGCVAQEAELATAAVRGMIDQASRVAALAAHLEAAAGVMEELVRQQVGTLAEARAALSANTPVIAALDESIVSIAAITDVMATVARESHILSLNARIEAARVDARNSAFGSVAAEMSTLAARSKIATGQISAQSSHIATSIRAATEVANGYQALVAEQQTVLARASDHAADKRATSREMVAITTEIVGIADHAAAAIGRVGATAVAVKVLARQLSKVQAAAA